MATICDNPKCTYHRTIPAKSARDPFRDVLEDNKVVRVERYLYRGACGGELFLCDVCHEAVRMIMLRQQMEAEDEDASAPAR